MSLLSDRDIFAAIEAGEIGLDPFHPAFVQPASVDVHLYEVLLRPDMATACIDVNDVPADHMHKVQIDEHGYPLQPGEFMLASTQERLRLGTRHAARAEGLSSLGRLGLSIHVTAGWLDPGFVGRVTLELVNHGPWELNLRPGMRIAQFAFFQTTSPVVAPYGLRGSYQHQTGPSESKYKMGAQQ